MKKKNNIEEELNKCTCDENCDCGCKEGKECTCEECDCTCEECECEECECEENDDCESECGGCCDSCGGCSGGSVDNETIIKILDARNKELEEKYMRLQAEYLNFKTRTQNEVSRMLQYEGEDFIKELLPIKDNLERAVMMDDNDLGDEVSKFLSGIKLVLGNIQTLFDKYQVKEIECLGLEFDPNIAEAVLVDTDENKPANVVLEVLAKGYKYKDKVIRHAAVKVNK